MPKIFALYILLLVSPLLGWSQVALTRTPGDYQVTRGLKIGNSTWVTPGLIKYTSNTWWGYNGSSWVDLGNITPQTLTLSNDTIYLTNGGFVVLPESSNFDGQYSSLSGAPTNVSYFINDAGYLTEDTALSEAQVDYYVSNNGFVTGTPWLSEGFITDGNIGWDNSYGFIVSEVDGSVTNEIQELSLEGDTISLTNSPSIGIPISNWNDAYYRSRYLDYVLDSTIIQGTPGSSGLGIDSTYYTLPTYSGTTYYINPTPGTPAGSGSFESPYNSWAGVTFTEGCTYLQLRGTTYNSAGSITPGASGVTVGIKIGAYGDSTLAKPKIIVSNTDPVIRLSGDNIFLVKDLEIQASRYGLGIRHDGPGEVWVYNCDIHGGTHNYWKYGPTTSQGTVKLLYSSFHDSWTDNIYGDDIEEIEIGHCNFYDCNMAYFTYPGDDGSSAAPGDNIQLATAYGPLTFHIHHSVIDHSSTGHKFCFIAWNGYTYVDTAWNAMNGLVTDNLIIGSRSQGFLGSNGLVYLGDMQAKDTVIFERNIFTDGSAAVYAESSNIRLSYNLIHNVSTGVVLSQARAALVLHNNTLANYSSAGVGAISSTSVISRNNAFSSGGAYAYNPNATYDSDYNYFQGYVSSGSTTLASWQGSSTNDDNSDTGDPLFKGVDSADYRPNTGSPLLDNGVPLGYSYDLSRDAITNPPSIGAYQNTVAPPSGEYIPGTPDEISVDSALLVGNIKVILGDYTGGNYAEFSDGNLLFHGDADLQLDWRNTPLARGETGEIQFNEVGLLSTDSLFHYERSSKVLSVPSLQTTSIKFGDNSIMTSASTGSGSGNFLVSTIQPGDTLPMPPPDIIYMPVDTITDDTQVDVTIPMGYALTYVYWDNLTTVSEINVIIGGGADNIHGGILTPAKTIQPITAPSIMATEVSLGITGNESPGIIPTLRLEKTPFYTYVPPVPTIPPYLDGNTSMWIATDSTEFYDLTDDNYVKILFDKAKRKNTSGSEVLPLPLDLTESQWTKTGTVTAHTANTFTTSNPGGAYRLLTMPMRAVMKANITGTSTNTPLSIYNNNNGVSANLIAEAGDGDAYFSSIGNYFYFRVNSAADITISSATVKRVDGNHLSHSTTSIRPTFADNAVEFNGTSQYLKTATGTTVTYQHAFIIGRKGSGDYHLYTSLTGFGELSSGVLTLGADGAATTFYDVDVKELVLRTDDDTSINNQIKAYLKAKYSVTEAP
jgi:hypothetical protein